MKGRLSYTGRIRVRVARHRELIKHYDVTGQHAESAKHFAEFCRLNRYLRSLRNEANP